MSENEWALIGGNYYEVIEIPQGLCTGGQSFHQHDEPHDDVPGGTSHHHHVPACLQVRAVLVPVGETLPEEIVVRQGREWEAVPVSAEHAEAHMTGGVSCTSSPS